MKFARKLLVCFALSASLGANTDNCGSSATTTEEPSDGGTTDLATPICIRIQPAGAKQVGNDWKFYWIVSGQETLTDPTTSCPK